VKSETQVYLVGAGPGDTGLITVKGLRCLQQADVVLYDKLANPEFLKEAPEGAELIYVGKVKGHHLLPQEQINELLEEKACAGCIVVRLKGGDPYIFGRGGEEAQHLEQAGIPFEVVPGITAGFAAAAYAGIPVTHRDCTTSVSLITGHAKPGNEEQTDINWKALASGNGTLVFYMGLSNIATICQELIYNGRAANTPVAIISCATTEQQQTLTTTLGEAPQQAEQNKIPTPSVIVVGEVVALRDQLRWFDSEPLSGRNSLPSNTPIQGFECSDNIAKHGVENTASKSLPVLLKNPCILLLGGGEVAYRKAKVLLDNQIEFKILTQSILPTFKEFAGKANLTIKQVHAADLKPFNIIVDATGNPAVAKLLFAEKQQRFVLINIVDIPEHCDFYFSSLLNYGRLKIAVSTDGASPTVGQVVRDKIKAMIPDNLADLLEEKAAGRSRGAIDAKVTREQTLTLLAQVYLIGCGPGDVNLLTLQAYTCIQKMDVVLYDDLIPQQILDIVPASTQQVYVGKHKEVHGWKQDDINQTLLDYARQGLQVARLKSGDPYISGRDTEEAEFLIKQGIRVQVLSGISSALSASRLPVSH